MTRFNQRPLVFCAVLVTLGVHSPAMANSNEEDVAHTLLLRPLHMLAQPSGAGSADSAPLDGDPSSEWRFDFNSWVWMQGFTGDVTARGRTANVDADFGDVLDASDSLVAVSGRLEVGYGKFAGYIDGIYADLGADGQSGPGGAADIDITLQQEILDFGVMYRILDQESEGAGAANPRNLTLDVYGGGRYNSIDLKVDPANFAPQSASHSWLDPIVGAKLGLPLSERWLFRVNADVGGFGVESDLTWSATAVFGFDFELFGIPATVLAGYRAISWDYSEGSGADEFRYDMTQHGPILGMSLRF